MLREAVLESVHKKFFLASKQYILEKSNAISFSKPINVE